MTLVLQKCPSMGISSWHATARATTVCLRFMSSHGCSLNMLMRAFIDMYHQVAYALSVHYQAQAKAMYKRQHSQEVTHIAPQLAVALGLRNPDLHCDLSSHWQSCPQTQLLKVRQPQAPSRLSLLLSVPHLNASENAAASSRAVHVQSASASAPPSRTQAFLCLMRLSTVLQWHSALGQSL